MKISRRETQKNWQWFLNKALENCRSRERFFFTPRGTFNEIGTSNKCSDKDFHLYSFLKRLWKHRVQRASSQSISIQSKHRKAYWRNYEQIKRSRAKKIWNSASLERIASEGTIFFRLIKSRKVKTRWFEAIVKLLSPLPAIIIALSF